MVSKGSISLSVLLGCFLSVCNGSSGSAVKINIAAEMPADIEGGAFNASLGEASAYAWSQFIALNWLAVPQTGAHGTRGVARAEAPVAGDVASSLRVWETLRAKTELFPGTGEPHGVTAGSKFDYGYDQSPLYRYDPAAVGTYTGLEPGLVPACFPGQQHNPPPWVELSESHEVGPEKMYMGAASNPRIQYAVNVSRNLYAYVVAKGWLGGGGKRSTIPAAATSSYIEKNFRAPPAGSSELVSFPDQSLQIKTAWKRLGKAEKSSGRFHTAMARSYQPQDPGQQYGGQAGNPQYPCFVDAQWGLIGMHIKTRTPSAPYYIWSTFEHIDNITDEHGRVVEDKNGQLIRNANLPATEPAITSRNAISAVPATPETIQKQSPAVAQVDPGKRLYYTNKTDTPTTQGKIAINRRDHAIPEPVVKVNQAAHQALKAYFDVRKTQPGYLEKVLLNYKLVGVQWKPADKPVPGQDVLANPEQKNEVLRYPGVYYLANIVLETSYRLQNYSGVVQHHLPPPFDKFGVQDLVTDFDDQGLPFKNVMYNTHKPDGSVPGYNMGGCMGCHGQMQKTGYEFSFIFRRGRINAPEMGDAIRMSLIDMVHNKPVEK